MKRFILILLVALELPAFAQINWREATTAEMSAATLGVPAVVTPRRLVGGTVLTTNNSMVPISSFGAKGGTNDDTVAFQAAANSAAAVFIDGRTNYTHGRITLTNGTCFIGNGAVIHFLTNGNVSGFMYTATADCTNIQIHNLVLDGMSWSFNINGNRNPWFLSATTNISVGYTVTRGAFLLPGTGTNIDISGNFINNFSDVGVRLYGSIGVFPQPLTPRIKADGLSIYNCFYGVQFTNSCEYVTLSGLQVSMCGYGVWIASGNDYIVGAQLVRNGCAVRVLGAAISNPAHGEVVGSTFNHCDIPIWCSDFNNGFVFIGDTILGGGGEGTSVMTLTNCSGVTFIGGEMSSGLSIVASGAGTNRIMSVMCSGMPSQFITAPAVLDWVDPFDFLGISMTSSNTVNNVWTGTNTFLNLNGNAIGLTNIIYPITATAPTFAQIGSVTNVPFMWNSNPPTSKAPTNWVQYYAAPSTLTTMQHIP